MKNKPIFIEFMGTPESGKTSVSRCLEERLKNIGYSVIFIQESAEVLPENIVKGSFEASVWMYLNTLKEVLNALSSNSDIVIADRGILDGAFYNMRFKNIDKIFENSCLAFDEFVKTLDIMPDFVVSLITTKEESIRRRGGEGRLVTLEYIERYNSDLLVFFSTVEVSKVQIDTTDKTIDYVTDYVHELILNGIY